MAPSEPGQATSGETAGEAPTPAEPSTAAAAADETQFAATGAWDDAATPAAQPVSATPEPHSEPPTAPAAVEPRDEAQPAPAAEPARESPATEPRASRDAGLVPPEAAAATAPTPATPAATERQQEAEAARQPASAAEPVLEATVTGTLASQDTDIAPPDASAATASPPTMEPAAAGAPSPEAVLPASTTPAPPSEESGPEPEVVEDLAALPAQAEPAAPAPRKGFWSRLASGLARTASSLGQGITDLVSKRKLDAETLEDLEDVLIRADLGVETAMRIVEAVGKGRHDKMISPDEVKGLIAAEVERILEPVAKPLVVDHKHRPFVVLMVGVNGSGKTTTIGKLAAQWRHEGKKVVLAAGDTFRAAAIDQLKVWGQRTGTRVIAKEPGADAAGVAHDALTEARAEGADILLIDTAGRLQNRTELMAELEKIVRVVKKLEPSAPHAVLLVLDATVGQNALSQVEAFTRIAGVTGLVMTKLDGTARGGILVAIAAKHRLPVHLIGVGEGADDLQPFTARDFARAIAGLD
ncbi:signal recognition particle-docking protein FtsY [Xanthobacter sediminis]|uniref:signal recognition particle-docking protein FtsY n=1 Tax=Xanthobacter sediminis TaxID=3119926 RepID=UPI00372B5F03